MSPMHNGQFHTKDWSKQKKTLYFQHESLRIGLVLKERSRNGEKLRFAFLSFLLHKQTSQSSIGLSISLHENLRSSLEDDVIDSIVQMYLVQ